MIDCIPATTGFLRQWLDAGSGQWLYLESSWWTAVGFTGAAVFGSRFLFQWLKSEWEKTLIVPRCFWHLSFLGSVLNLLYALHLDNPPLIFATLFLPLIYGRNLVLLYRGGRAQPKG